MSEQRLDPFAADSRTTKIETVYEELESQYDIALSRFASSLGTTSDSSPGASASCFMQCLSSCVAGEAVVCSLPSLDMPPPSEASEGQRESFLPALGEHREKVPEMAASVLISAATATSSAELLEQHAAVHLGTLTSWTKSSLVYAPHAINKNISGALSSLIDSRVQAWTLLLLRHSLTMGDKASRSRLLSMLSCSIKVKSTTTTFKTLPMPPSARGHPKEADAILPLLFEARLILSIQDKEESISVRAPGTIAGIFAQDGTTGVTRVDVRLDTGALLESMIEQARLAVFKAVARATRATNRTTIPFTSAPIEHATPSGFRSSLSSADTTPTVAEHSLSQPQPIQLLKAQSSAVRLSNILHGKSDEADKGTTNTSLIKTRKNRSVKWNSPMEIPSRDITNFPSPKRQRMVKAQLRSTKSFGRPHAEHGAGPRNATFGEFGSTAVTWGKNGRLQNHPVPGGRPMAPQTSTFENTAVSTQNQNAMFDFHRETKVSLETLSALGVGRSAATEPTSGTNMPRTATALENWLVNATKGGAASGLR